MATEGYPEDVEKMLFAAARTKLLRARQFIAELEIELDEYKANEPLSATIDLTNGVIHVSWKSITMKPGAITGDVVHNLRACLDAIASELARLNGKSDKDVYFPFASSEEHLEAAISNRCFRRAGADAVELLRTLKPYRGGNDKLRALHDLDIQDKHTGILLTSSRMGVSVSATYDVSGVVAPAVEANLSLMNYIFPEDSLFFPGLSCVETLKELLHLVEKILAGFVGLVSARK